MVAIGCEFADDRMQLGVDGAEDVAGRSSVLAALGAARSSVVLLVVGGDMGVNGSCRWGSRSICSSEV